MASEHAGALSLYALLLKRGAGGGGSGGGGAPAPAGKPKATPPPAPSATAAKKEKVIYVEKVEEAPRLRRAALSSVLRPLPGARNVLITSALPYVNNVPHLGNIIGCVLSADVYARYARARGWNALYVCGTDEYGTATETKALEEGLTPRAICDKYHVLHRAIYEWFDIAFDHFGRTSTADPWKDTAWPQTRICQEIFLGNCKEGNVTSAVVDQMYCLQCQGFLADRLIEGVCPLCGYEDARGDQCDKCGKLLSATELLRPTCKRGKTLGAASSGGGGGGTNTAATATTPPQPHAVEVRSSQHLFLDLPKLSERLDAWITKASKEGAWTENACQITRAWVRDGLKPRCITRDLKWGTPVPYAGFEGKVFYVWFDAPIGYLSITADYMAGLGGEAWREWWQAPPPGADVKLYQFMGKDNIPFHTVIFPASLLGSGSPFTLLHHVSTTEYLNYETGKFSKSRGVGVFGDSARDTGIPSEVWRYYLLQVRPELSDAVFSWADFADKCNNELLKNIGNLVNRSLSFSHSTFEGHLPPQGAPELLGAREAELAASVNALLATYHEAMEGVKLKAGIQTAMLISAAGNLYMQDTKPWELAKTNLPRCAAIVHTIVSLVRQLSAVLEPFMPGFTDKVCFQLNLPHAAMPLAFATGPAVIPETVPGKGHPIPKPRPIFSIITPEDVEKFRAQFAGTQAEAAAAGGGGAAPAPAAGSAAAAAGSGGKGAAAAAGKGTGGAGGGKVKGGGGSGGQPKPAKVDLSSFPDIARVDLRVGRIVKCWPHPEADKCVAAQPAPKPLWRSAPLTSLLHAHAHTHTRTYTRMHAKNTH